MVLVRSKITLSFMQILNSFKSAFDQQYPRFDFQIEFPEELQNDKCEVIRNHILHYLNRFGEIRITIFSSKTMEEVDLISKKYWIVPTDDEKTLSKVIPFESDMGESLYLSHRNELSKMFGLDMEPVLVSLRKLDIQSLQKSYREERDKYDIQKSATLAYEWNKWIEKNRDPLFKMVYPVLSNGQKADND